MPDILFIKTSSLGDVIHHMPAVTEARARRPGLRIDWVVERAFAPLVGLHPAVHEAIPIGQRDWRKAWFRPSVWSERRAFFRSLGARRYDAIVDTQGLLFKSALVARRAHGIKHGYDTRSIKERLASRFYDVRHAVDRQQHAIARNRALTGLALGYAPQGAPDYGLNRTTLADPWAAPYALLLHATTARRKEWPEPNWHTLAAVLARDIEPVLLHGSDRERARSERIAAAAPRAQVPERQPLDAVARLIAGAAFVVGVDTGLMHLAAALGVPLVAIFAGSEPGLTGPIGAGPIEVLGGQGARVSVDDVLRAVERIRT
jgi:lipopolysaccharide heptosyltransferase I